MARDFQKFVMLLQTLSANPALAAAFDKKYSIIKLMGQLMKAMQIDPTSLEKDAGAGPEMPLELLGGTGGGGSPPSTRTPPPTELGMAPTNPLGDRGTQTP
jgi:hypothetical protein